MQIWRRSSRLGGKFLLLVPVLVVGLAASPLPAFGASPFDQLQPRHWYEVPNSRLRSVLPDPLPPGYTAPAGLISAWSGGTYDTARDRLLVWGGGHADYSGNEIYAFDVDTLSWSRVWGPTPNDQIPTGDRNYETYLDGSPAARHTYDGLVYLPAPYDALWEQGGSLWRAGYGTLATWQFRFGSGQWQRKADAADTMFGVNAQYDPVTDHVIHRGRYWISEYDPATDTWTQRFYNGAGWWNDSSVSALDPVRRLMVIVGNGEFLAYNIDAHTLFSPPALGDTEVIGADAPGVAYDPVSDAIVAWMGGADVYTLDLDSWIWTRVPAAPTNTVIPDGPTGTGTYGRWQYIPSENAFVVVSGVDQNVFLYRLTPEPSSLLLLAAGAMPILQRRRHRC